MEPVAAVDFESYYDKTISIKTMGVWHYLRATDIYLASIVTNDGLEWVGHPKDFDWRSIARYDWLSHNRSFDAQVYARLRELNHVPEGHWANWYCTADMAAYLGSPRSLAGACEDLMGIKVEKDVRDRMSGKKWMQMSEEFREEVKRYALTDSVRCRDLWLAHGNRWPHWERELSQLTYEMALVGVAVDEPLVTQYIGHLKRLLWEADRQIPWAGSHPALSMKQLVEACRRAGIMPPKSLAMDSEDCAAWEEEHGDAYPWVAAMRQKRRANTLLKKFQTLHSRIRPDGRASLPLKYCGASTRRWSGDAGFNAQNMTRGELLGTEARNALVASPGKKLIAADLSQIEPRVLAVLSGDTVTLELLKKYDIYEAHARSTMGFDREESLESLQHEPQYERMRRLAKARVLGLGYGCGPDKFVTVAKTMAKLDVSPDEAIRIVAEFRQQNPKIVRLWRRMQRALERSVGKDLVVGLPSGNKLVYKSIACKDGEYTGLVSKNGRMCRVKLYGGLLVENLVQAVARDVFGTGMLRIRAEGHTIVLQTHDEAAVEVDESFPASEIVSLLTVPPEWMPTVPLAAKAKEGVTYAF